MDAFAGIADRHRRFCFYVRAEHERDAAANLGFETLR